MANTKLDNALLSFAQVAPHFGPPDTRGRDVQLEKLRSDLKAISDSNNRYFTICVAMVLILFAGACALVIFSVSQPGQITAVFGATGLSFFGIIRQMLKLWKEKVNSDIFITLAGSLDSVDLRKIVNAMLKARLGTHS